MYFIAAVGISARSRSKGKRVLIESELEFLQRQENTHRNKICKFQHYHSREFRVLRSTKISNTFFYIIHSHVTYASKLGLPVSDLQSRAKRVETLCLLRRIFGLGRLCFLLPLSPISMSLRPQNLSDNLTYSTLKRGRGNR